MFNFLKTMFLFNPILTTLPTIQELLLQLLAEPVATQTDVESPINQALMDAIRASLDSAPIGHIMFRHDYNGTIGAPNKYMQCKGTQITETNYNAEHTTTWANDIVTTVLENKYLPNMANKYVIVKNATSQNGNSAITFVGNTDSEIDLEHTHTIDDHNHKWFEFIDNANSDDYSYDANGDNNIFGYKAYTPSGGTGNTNLVIGSTKTAGATNPDQDYFTNNAALSPANGLTVATDITPHSLELEAWMKIV